MFESALKPFGAYLTDLLARHNLSAATVSRMLGHKSRTTLRRILQDQANMESIEKFLTEFISAQLIPLTPEEEQNLRQSCEISRLGLPDFLARRDIWNLLHTSPLSADGSSICLINSESGDHLSLHQFFQKLSAASDLHLLIINSIPGPFFSAFSRFIRNFPDKRIEIEHYLFLNSDIDRTINFISTIFPMLHMPCYSAYAIPAASPDKLNPSGLTSSIIACTLRLPDGSSAEYQLGFANPTQGYLIQTVKGVYDFWKGMLAPSMPLRVSMKHSSSVADSRLANYLNIARMYRDLEHNHAIYMIKPGLCLSLIAPHILDAALAEGLVHTEFSDSPEISEYIRLQHEIHQQRFDNIYQKKRVTHIIIPCSSLRSFAQTGRMTDHFFGMRPFTVDERREILIHCRNQSRDNPYFNIYFTKDESIPLELEAACYEPVGVLLHGVGTNYNLAEEHAAALITLNDFTALFSQFFRDTLLSLYAHSVSTSVTLLNSLIDELPKSE